jgi:hypothetical protein
MLNQSQLHPSLAQNCTMLPIHSGVKHIVIVFFFFPVSFQGNLQHEYSGTDCRHLNGPEVHTEVSSLLEYLRLCMFFSKKTFSAFLKFGGYNQEDILIHKARARVSK